MKALFISFWFRQSVFPLTTKQILGKEVLGFTLFSITVVRNQSELEICCCCSVAQSWPTLCNPMECSTPGFPVFHYLPRVCSNACPLSRWCHPVISSSVVPFSSCLQSFPESGSFPVVWLFASGGQSIGASASVSVLLMNIQGWFPLGFTGLIPCSPRDPEESSPAPEFKLINSLALSFLYGPVLTSIHGYWKNHSFD